MLSQEQLQKLWENAEQAEADGKLGGGEFKELSDGEYYGVIKSAKQGVTKGGYAKVELTLEITEGEFKRRLHWSNMLLESSSPLTGQITIKALDKLAKEFKIIDSSQNITQYPLDDVLESFTDREVRFVIKTKGDFKNTYIHAC